MLRPSKDPLLKRDRQRIVLAGTIGFAVTVAMAEAAVAYSLSQFSLSVISALFAGVLLSTSSAGSFSAWYARRGVSEQNARLDAALNNMIQGLCMFDAQNRLVVWNERYRAMYNIDPLGIWRGCTISDLLKARIAAGMFPLDPEKYDRDLRAALKQGKYVTLNIDLADGRTISVVNQPIESGGWVATHEDVSERKRAERELENTRSFLNMIIENVPSPIIVKDPDLRYLLFNRAAEKCLGVDRSVLLGKTAAEVMPGMSDTVDEHDRQLLESGKSIFVDEHAVATPGNGTRIVTAARLPVMGPDGKVQYLISMIHDVTDRKRDELRLAHMAQQMC
jgi:PAS domain S-box-containing protein